MGLEWSFLIRVTQETGFGDTMPGVKRDFYNVCPDCWSVMIKHRVFKSPRYKCEKCGSEFPNKKRVSYVHRKMFNDVLKLTRRKLKFTDAWQGDSEIKLRKAVIVTIKEYLSHA